MTKFICIGRALPSHISNLGNCNLPFDLAQGGGELVEPFDICNLRFGIYNFASL